MKFYTSAVESDNKILLRGYENGRAFMRKVAYEPILYIPSRKESSWKSINNQSVEPIKFENIKEAKQFIKQYEDIENYQIFGFPRFVYSFLNEEYPGEVQYDRDLISVATIDIEVASHNGFPSVEFATEEVTAITLKKNNVFYTFGCREYISTRSDVKYIRCRNEKELLESFLIEWSKSYPDIVTGWSIRFFDIPYLFQRMSIVLGEKEAKKLSPWRQVYKNTVSFMNRDNTTATIIGVCTLDYLELYRKFTYVQQESYKLNNIAHIELDERKIDYSEYETLHNLYLKDFTKFIDYNIKDVDLVDKLDDKMKLIDLVFALAYDAKVNFDDTFMQVRMWDTLIHNHLFQKNIVISATSAKNEKNSAYEGAYVKNPQVGLHKWIVSFDLNSLYPHLIMQYNISPDTITDKFKEITIDQFLNKSYDLPIIENHSLAPNGWYFSNKHQGFLPELMQKMYDDRVLYKERMIEAQKNYEKEENPIKKREYAKLISRNKNIQMAKKIQLNSAYGAIGNPYFRFFDLKQATAITLGGQLSIRWAENEINAYMNKVLGTKNEDFVIASDTDSLYIIFDKLVQKVFEGKNPSTNDIVDFLNNVSEKKIEPFICRLYSDLAKRTNAYAQKMIMKREIIADRGIWTAKKRYILNTLDSEGVRFKEPKLKIAGIEAVKSSTPEACRKAIKEALNIIITSDEDALQEYVRNFKDKFYSLSFENISFPRGVQNLDEYSSPSNTKPLPIHVRAAIVYNKNIKKMKLNKKYEMIKEGEKIKYCYMKMPNVFHQNVLGILNVLPKEFNIEEYIDYDLQFQKAFLEPLRSILNVINWKEEKRNTIEDFFS